MTTSGTTQGNPQVETASVGRSAQPTRGALNNDVLIDLTQGTVTESPRSDVPGTASVGRPTSTRVQAPEVIDLTGGDETAYFIDLTQEATTSLPAAPAASTAIPAAQADRVAMQTPATPEAPLPKQGVVVRVVDGDTYLLADGNRVRLSGVNTPEKSEAIGMFVKEEIIRFLTNKEVTLVYGSTARDHYGRLVAEVWVDGQSMAEYLLRNGYAHLFVIPPGRPARLDAMIQAQREARAASKGIWAEERYRGPMHITSFHANARGNDRESPEGEYLRIANTTSGPLNLAGFSVTNLKGRTLQLPAVTIPEGYTFQIVSGNGAVQGSDSVAYKVFWNSNGPVWNNDEEKATLIDPQGRWVDEATHSPKRSNLKQ